MLAIDGLGEKLAQGIEFPGFRSLGRAEQPQVATRLPQPQERGEYAHAGGSRAAACVLHCVDLRACGLLELGVGGLLLVAELDFDDLLDFVGELREDLLLAAAQQVGAQAAVEPLPGGTDRAVQQRRFVGVLEIARLPRYPGRRNS